MKKIFGLIAILLLLSGCDDGEMTFQTFNFTGSPVECTLAEDTYIVTNGNEALILDLSSDPLVNIQSETNSAGQFISDTIILGAGKLLYRVYNDDVNPTDICSALGNPDLTVKEQWTGSGTLDVITTRSVATNGTISYTHSITIVDASFTKSGETIRIEDNYLGIITTQLGVTFNFGAKEEDNPNILGTCTLDTNRKYLLNNLEAILLQLSPGTFDNTAAEDVKTIELNAATAPATANRITVKVFSGSGMTPAGICTGDGPTTPIEVSRWVANTGTVVIKRTLDSGVYNYDIYLSRDVVFYNRTTDNGEFFTPEPNFPNSTGGYADYYYLGRYIN